MALDTAAARAATDRICHYFEHLSPASLGEIDRLYTPQARFKDPFNEVHGTAAIRGIFEHMYASLHEPRFVVTQRIVDGAQVFLVWEFHFRFQRFDPQQPRIAGINARTRFRHYINLERTEGRLKRLLADFHWDRVDRVFDLEAR